MSKKEEKPTLAGVNVKTRKRNIVVPEDPKTFANAVIQIIKDASEGVSVEKDLEAATKVLESSDAFDFKRYGETLFEIFYAGGRLAGGGTFADESDLRLDNSMFTSAPTREAIVPYIKVIQNLTRRKPFLIKSLEKTMTKLLLSVEFFEPDRRKILAISFALIFSMKIGVLPENIFSNMFNDRLVTKGTMLEFVTNFFQELLVKDSMDDLVSLLTKGRVVNRLIEFFPPNKRTLDDFNAHFEAAGLEKLVEFNTKREVESKLTELQNAIQDLITADPPATEADVVALAKSKKAECGLPDADILKVGWQALVKSINMTGKNNQQIVQALAKQIKAYKSLLSTYATNGKLELSLLVTIQVVCYEDNRLLKLFSDIVRVLYDLDVLGEDTVLHWYKKGSHPKGRNVFLKDIEPFIKWLEEAEEEDEDEEE
jgi:hypothetical protein